MTDIQAAFRASNMTPEAFLECCTVKIGALKDAFCDANAGLMDVDSGKKAT